MRTSTQKTKKQSSFSGFAVYSPLRQRCDPPLVSHSGVVHRISGSACRRGDRRHGGHCLSGGYAPRILPMYIPMVPAFGIHFVMLLIGKTRYPRRMLIFHPVTWMSVMSQSSTNTAVVIRRTAAAIYETKKEARHRCHDASILKDEGYGHSVTVLLAAVKTQAARIHRISKAPLDVSAVSIPFPPPNLRPAFVCIPF